MPFNPVAEVILTAVRGLAAETRLEDKVDPATSIESTNQILRRALGARGEVPYPSRGGRCDMVVDTAAGPLWLEVKHAWTWDKHGEPGRKNPSYRKHLLGGGNRSALHDARTKLPRLLGQPCASTIGMLVIALDSDQLRHEMRDIEELARRAGMDREPWRYFTLPRWMSLQAGYASVGIQPHLWLRPTTPQPALA